MWRRLAPVMVAVAALAAACGPPDYEEPEICGVSSDAVARALETRGFEVAWDKSAPMPYDGDEILDVDLRFDTVDTLGACLVDSGDQQLRLVTEIVTVQSEAGDRRDGLTAEPDGFFRDGEVVGYATETGGQAMCGQVVVTARVEDDTGNGQGAGEPEGAREVLDELVELAGCWAED
ncbi:hypothetical protein ACHAAC_03020 [Aeromicrobium sp. CF4.19]|uniref:hypothetical protein n=1 Tax=Aeromicrobium sp. CF4.19 TaxID=3373082 RepID=UPI003EE718A8